MKPRPKLRLQRLDSSTDENKKMNAPGLEKSIKLQFKRPRFHFKSFSPLKFEDIEVVLVIKAESQLERDYVKKAHSNNLTSQSTAQPFDLFNQDNQKDCRRAKLEMDWFEFEFNESCLVGPTTQEEINLVTRLPKKTKQLADWVEVLTEAERSYNGTDKTGELATVVHRGFLEEGQNEELAMVIRTINGADEVLDYPGGVWRIDVGTVRGLDKRTEEQRIQDKEDGGLQEEKKETGQRSKTEKQRIEDIGVKEAPIKARSFISLNNKSIIKE
ncbi:hypothetical protein PPACK8108_LOCUS510 [Phakopsora pachyrhizi]|uniref:Uncharacterized protein n=1 Tax=Phakopsora pachyrhizi TaxID=170000 RepID=A0AAV0ADS4_PHAPC|nr:hypothetical protein PPACK8108_LOCUS510 [Phakopsora pachyrhizi]